MNILLPKQHGAWAMLIVPFVLGADIGGFTWLHVPLFIGWLLLYLSTYPLMMWAKNKKRNYYGKWFLYYFASALPFLVVPIVKDWKLLLFGLLILPFLLINLYYAKRNDDRALMNDFSAIAAFGVGGLASYYLGMGKIDGAAWGTLLITMLFFMGSTFFVKTMIREKHNPVYRLVSWGFHTLVIFAFIVAGYAFLAILFIPSLIRAIGLYGQNVSMMKVGVLEIANSVYFLIMMFILY